MPVTESLMKAGSWDLTLIPETPREVLDAIEINDVDPNAFGHVIIAPTWIDPLWVSPDDLVSRARYVGVYRRQDGLRLEGAGLGIWAGDELGLGPPFSTAIVAETFEDSIAAALPAWLTAGTITALGGSLTWTPSVPAPTCRDAWDYICRYFAAEWRVNNDFTVDAGQTDDLYLTTPQAIIHWQAGGREPGLRGIRGAVAPASHVEEYYSAAIVSDGASFPVASQRASFPYKDPAGNALDDWARVISDPSDTVPSLIAQATAWLLFAGFRGEEFTVATDAFDPVGDIGGVGCPVWAFNPERGVHDPANQVMYQGELTAPLSLRLYEATWSLRRGMGVTFRDGAGTLTDLTRWIDFSAEPVESTLQIGSRVPTWAQAVRSRFSDFVA